MRDLLAGPLTHFFIRCTFAGGSGTSSGTIYIGSSLLIRSLGGDALNADGTLKDASEITWYNDKDDVIPIASGSNPRISHGRMRNSARMAEIIEAEAQTSDTDKKKRRRKVKGKAKAKGTIVESDDDAEFLGSSSEDSSSSDEGDQSDDKRISNKEVLSTLSAVYGCLVIFLQLADSLLSKTIPAGKKRSSKANSKKKQRPKKRPRPLAADTADEDAPVAPSTTSTAKLAVPKKVL